MGLGDSAGILFRIKADSADAVKDIGLVKGELSGLGTTANSTGEQLSAFAGPAGIAAAAVVAIGVASLATVRELFDLTKSASEYGSVIHDAADKTGLTAETISTLKLAAESSGGSLEQVTNATAKLARLMGEAAGGNEKAAATLKLLGVTSNDLHTALGEVIKSISEAKDGTDQLVLAQKAFGRAGAEMIPLIKQIGGDLKAAEEDARRLGTTISEKDAAAADEFGDKLKLLDTQLKVVAFTVGAQLMPVFEQFFDSMSGWIASNQREIHSWAVGITFAIQTVIGSMQAYIRVIKALALAASGDILGATNALVGPNGQTAQAGGAPADKSDLDLSKLRGGGGGGKGGGGKGSAADNAEAERRKLIAAEEKANSQRLTSWRAFLQMEGEELKTARDQQFITEDRYVKAVGELHLKELYFERQLNDDLLKDDKLNADERHDIEVKQQVLEYKIGQERIKIGNDVYEAIKKQTEKELADFKKKEEERRKEARKTANERAKLELSDNEKEAITTKNAQNLSILGDSVLSVRNQAGNLTDMLKPTLPVLQMMGGMVNSLAQGFGNLVQQMVLTGTAGPHAMKKLVASVLAGVAAQAATLAIMETAYGIAALTPWGAAVYGPAVAHFKAAALFAIVAASAGLAGRAVAGNAFNQQATAATGGGGQAQQPQHNDFTTQFGGFRPGSAGDRIANGQQGSGLAGLIQHQVRVLGQLEETSHQLATKINGVSPGHVLQMGVEENPTAVARGYESTLSNDVRRTNALMRNTGQAG